MYTHELADALKQLSTALKRGPNIDVGGLPSIFDMAPPRVVKTTIVGKSEDLPIALSALLSLSRVDKQEWIALIGDLGLNIEIRPRDASRDILGKVLKRLESDPEARTQLQRRVSSRTKQASPDLARALSSLLNR